MYNTTVHITINKTIDCIIQVQTNDVGSNPSLIGVDSEPFVISKIQDSCKLESFRKMHDLEPGVCNIFVEVPNGYKHNKSSVLDVILVDEVSILFGLCYFDIQSGNLGRLLESTIQDALHWSILTEQVVSRNMH